MEGYGTLKCGNEVSMANATDRAVLKPKGERSRLQGFAMLRHNSQQKWQSVFM